MQKKKQINASIQNVKKEYFDNHDVICVIKFTLKLSKIGLV